jgi:hypothetical protein
VKRAGADDSAKLLARAADEAFARGDGALAARRYEVLRLAYPSALEGGAEARRLAAWIDAGDADVEGLERHCSDLEGELTSPLLEPCVALIESHLAIEPPGGMTALAGVQRTIERLPARSLLRRRIAEKWIALATRTYDTWRHDRFGFSADDDRAIIGPRGVGEDALSRILKRKSGMLLENMTKIFDAFGRAVTIDPVGDRFPRTLTPTLTLVRLTVAPEHPPWGDARTEWDTVMDRLLRAQHPLASYVRARYHRGELRASFELAVTALRDAPRDDPHIRGLAHGFVELARLDLSKEQLMALVPLANYAETWAHVGIWGRGHETLPPGIKGELFFLDEMNRE